MKWRVIGHIDDGFEVEFEDGSKLNFNARDIVEKYQAGPRAGMEPIPNGVTLRGGGAIYIFDKGAILAEHKHDINSLHTIECVYGRVLVKRNIQGDIELSSGDLTEILVDEFHSIIALEKAETVHRIVHHDNISSPNLSIIPKATP
jgi:quercetin dioxygenase-like cupin family protein